MPSFFVPRTSLLALVAALFSSAAAVGCVAEIDGPDAEDAESVGEASQAVWGDHVTTAASYMSSIKPANNTYGSPAQLAYNASGDLIARVECGSFTSLLMRNTYAKVTTTVLSDLTGSTSPFAWQWYDGIKPAASRPSSDGISLIPADNAATSPTGRTMSYLAVGDILASKYTVGSSTGHVMTVAAITTTPPANEQRTLLGTRVIPGVTHVKRWQVTVYDSTSSVHGSTDSRYGKDATEDDGHDHGIGSGSIYLYEDATTGSATLGQLVGWTWSTASSYTYQFTDTAGVDNNNKTTYRPMVIGRFSGL